MLPHKNQTFFILLYIHSRVFAFPRFPGPNLSNWSTVSLANGELVDGELVDGELVDGEVG